MKFRLLCFCSHLLISCIVALIVFYLVFSIWYPSPLDKALGVSDIFLLLLSIDLIMGPLLTLLVAQKGKKNLKFDLFIIGIVQSIALIYGVYIVAQGRPVWLIYDAGHFEVAQAYDAAEYRAPGSLTTKNLGGPAWASIASEKVDISDKREIYSQPKPLKTLDEGVAVIVGAHAMPLDILSRFNDPAKVNQVLRYYPEADGVVPMAAKQTSVSVLVRKSVGLPIAIVNLSPW